MGMGVRIPLHTITRENIKKGVINMTDKEKALLLYLVNEVSKANAIQQAMAIGYLHGIQDKKAGVQ